MKSSHGVVEANDRIYLGVKAYNKELKEKIKELFGKSMENVFRDSQKSEKRIHKQYMYDSNYHKEGDLYEANLNKGQAFYVWLTWRQPDGKMKLEADGWTEDSMTEIESFIGDKVTDALQYGHSFFHICFFLVYTFYSFIFYGIYSHADNSSPVRGFFLVQHGKAAFPGINKFFQFIVHIIGYPY